MAYFACVAPVWAQKRERHVVLRVDFADSGTAAPRYSRAQVEQMLTQVTELFTKISNGQTQLDFEVSDVIRLPGNRSAYNSGGQMDSTMQDAIAAAPQGLWGNVHTVIVLLSNAREDGGSYYRNRNVGPSNGSGGNQSLFVGNAVVGENPGDVDTAVWGRWAHEVGHNLQVGYYNGVSIGGHPSGYQSDFDLMDTNYPGRTGAVSLQSQFPGWLAPGKYKTFTPALGGGSAQIVALEYDQNLTTDFQAVKVDISNTGTLYYMVSHRRRVFGDELQPRPGGTPGIPDEGVLIERVDLIADPQAISTVIGRFKRPGCPPNCNRQKLWRAGDTFRSLEATIRISHAAHQKSLTIEVAYNPSTPEPDLMINPWLSPPGNTFETTDIWVDSPVNGFGVFRYGMQDDGSGGTVPAGNGDDPAVGQTNRVYARIRNIGTANAMNVSATIEVESPMGTGGLSAAWLRIGKVDSKSFPLLRSIAGGDFVDVYVNWTPTFTPKRQQSAGGVFYHHSGLRVRIDPAAGETVLANQDGIGEQEDVSYFEVYPKRSKIPPHRHLVTVHNRDPKNPRRIILGYRLTAPERGAGDWQVRLNDGVQEMTLKPGERREVPIEIASGMQEYLPGQRYLVDVFVLSYHQLVNRLNSNDRHNDFQLTGGSRIEALIVAPSKLSCAATSAGGGVTSVVGKIEFSGQEDTVTAGQPIMAIGSRADGGFLEETRVMMVSEGDGSFRGLLQENRPSAISGVECMFAGTMEKGSAWQSVPITRAKAVLR